VMAPASANSLDTSPMRRMFSARSSALRRDVGAVAKQEHSQAKGCREP
jgi:hypothetical protein